MAGKKLIDELVSEKAFEQEAKLLNDLKNLNETFTTSIKNAKAFSDSLAGSKGLKDVATNSTKARKELESLNKLQAQTAITQQNLAKATALREAAELRLSVAQEKVTANAAKQEAADNKKTKTVISNSQAEIDAYNRSRSGQDKLAASTNEANRATAAAANQATAYSGAVNNQTQAVNTNNVSKKRLAQILAEEKLIQQQNTSELKNNSREQLNAKGSLEQRRAALIRLTTVYDRLSKLERESASGSRMGNIIKGLTDQVKELEYATGRAQRNVGNYGSGSTSFFGSIKENILGTLGPMALLTAGIAALKTAFSHNVEISDSFVDVQRTAKLSADEVDELGEKLKKINTRTSLEGLLDIGFIGGRLGVAKEDLVSFIATVDQLSVVLKKEFPGGADAVATALGKIISVYKITQKQGISLEQALKNTGSAFLDLAHSGQVNVQYLQDFALRTAGVAQIAKISLPTMLAYGAVLSQTGISAQVAGTSVTRLISNLSTKREQFFAIAQLSDSTLTIEKFTDLINTDTKAALELFFKGLKAGNPTTTEFSDRLKTLGLTTGAAKNAVIALAENQQLLADKTRIANKANDEGTSVAHNFELANNSLAASFEKIGNQIANAFTNSSASRKLAELLNAITANRSEAEKLTYEYKNNHHAAEELEKVLGPLVKRYDELKLKSSLNVDEQTELRDITSKIGALLPSVTTKFDDYGNALDINRKKVRELTFAQRQLLELQNRSALKKANAQFDEAYFVDLPRAKQNATRAAALQQNSIDKFLDFFQGGNSDAEAKQNARDQVTRLSATAYEAAKAVRDLGGTLSKTQQDIINYYELLNKKPIKKQDATITGDGTDLPIDDGVRTIDDIKADIKRVQAIMKPLGVATKEYNGYLKQLIALRKELAAAMGKGTGGSSKSNTYTQSLQYQRELLDGLMQDEKLTYDERLKAIDNFEKRSKELVSQGVKSREFTRIEGKTKDLKITNDADKERLDLAKNAEAALLKIFKEGIEEQNRLTEERKQAVQDFGNSELERIQQNGEDALIALEEQYAKGKISKADYERQKLDIEYQANRDAIQAQLDTAKKLLDIQEAAGMDVSAQKKTLSELTRKLAKADADYEIAQLKTVKESRDEAYAKAKELAEEVFNFGTTLVNAGFENEKNKIQERSDAITEQTAKEIDAVGRSIGTEQEKADKIALINAKAKSQQDVLDARKREIAVRQAKFNKAISLAHIVQSTYEGAARALADYPFPFSSIIAGLVIAIGAAQAAQVIATPIPKYAKGTDYHKGGAMIVGDAGTELVIQPDGKQYLTPDTDTLTSAPKGTKVIPNHEVIKMLAKPDKINYVGGQAVDISSLVSEQRKTTKAIQQQKMASTLITKGGWKKQQQTITNWNAYRKNHFN